MEKTKMIEELNIGGIYINDVLLGITMKKRTTSYVLSSLLKAPGELVEHANDSEKVAYSTHPVSELVVDYGNSLEELSVTWIF